METFQSMKLPQWAVEHLASNGITRPTPIQMQGIPVALTGRDMIGVAFTGSGKTLTFLVPAIFAAVAEELRMPIRGCEGPVCLVVCPSRELARQTFEVLNGFANALETATVDYKEIVSKHTRER